MSNFAVIRRNQAELIAIQSQFQRRVAIV